MVGTCHAFIIGCRTTCAVVEEPGEDPKMVKISDVELGDVVCHRANHANKHGMEVRDKA
jgi:hypothetical protein